MQTTPATSRGAACPAGARTAQGPSPARRRRLVLAVVALAALGALGVYRVQRHNFKRFQEVRPGVYYRMGAPSEYGLRRLAEQYGLRTVVCLYEEEPRLKAGLFYDPGEPSGMSEREAAEQLGVRFLHWPLAGQAHWPWPTPQRLEEFYRLMDDPDNWPVLVHCRAGKHRAGTMAAIFRLEYDRWEAQAALDEMYAFDFGTPRAIQEHNLRTYAARPRPGPAEWLALLGGLGEQAADYDELVRRLRAARPDPAVGAALETYVQQGRPFALCLAARLVGGADDPILPAAVRRAQEVLSEAAREGPGPLESGESGPLPGGPAAWARDVGAAAGLVADYGPSDARRRLLELLAEGTAGPSPSPFYQALVAGVTNRYAPERTAFLRPLLDDLRQRPEPAAAMYRYADTAVARLASIVDVDLLGREGPGAREDWDRGIEAARKWFAANATPHAIDP